MPMKFCDFLVKTFFCTFKGHDALVSGKAHIQTILIFGKKSDICTPVLTQNHLDYG